MKQTAILGSTGSIGTQALEVLDFHGERPVVLTAYKNAKLLEKQARRFLPELVCLADEQAGKQLATALADTSVKVTYGRGALLESAAYPKAEQVLNALVGISGLEPTLAALEQNKTVLLANKESLVCGGGLVMKPDNAVLPVDSEHSAIFQCLQAGDINVKKILLTASGGSFLGWTREQLATVTPEMALKHPNWSMGAKVTVDSATLMNKGLEYIEAMWLFSVQNIEVIIHPQSIIHSMIEYYDGGIIAQLGAPDMRLPIQYAMDFPNRNPCPGKPLDLCEIGKLTFFKPDMNTFPCLSYAIDAAKKGGNAGVALNAADEIAVEAFLQRKISFSNIPTLIEKALNKLNFISSPSLEDILETDKSIRRFTELEILNMR